MAFEQCYTHVEMEVLRQVTAPENFPKSQNIVVVELSAIVYTLDSATTNLRVIPCAGSSTVPFEVNQDPAETEVVVKAIHLLEVTMQRRIDKLYKLQPEVPSSFGHEAEIG